MDRVSITCTETDVTVEADVLTRTDRFIKVVLDGSTEPIELYKDTPTARVYIGYIFGMEVTSEGV